MLLRAAGFFNYRRIGFDRIERTERAQAAHLLYKIIASRSQKRRTALVTNVDFDKWGEYPVDGPLAMALLDRLVVVNMMTAAGLRVDVDITVAKPGAKNARLA